MRKKTSQRNLLSSAQRIVVKVGSRVLIKASGKPNSNRIEALADELCDIQQSGREPICITSGAIGAGLEALNWQTRPKNLADLQMSAAIGQNRLMSLYDKFFSARSQRIAQILLTHDGLNDRTRHLNARNTILNLLRHKVIPIVNENDSVATEEIKFGDNDLLAALVAILVDADALILLTTVNGVHNQNGKANRIPLVREVNDKILALANGRGSHLSSGGMLSKLKTAKMASHNGIPVVIGDGRSEGVLKRILEGRDEGTLILPGENALSKRKRWIAFFNRAEGALKIDEGAAKALIQNGKSLLPIGICGVEGNFEMGAMLKVHDESGNLIAQGLTEYGSGEISKIMGHQTDEIEGILNANCYDEVIHRDNMVVMQGTHLEPNKL